MSDCQDIRPEIVIALEVQDREKEIWDNRYNQEGEAYLVWAIKTLGLKDDNSLPEEESARKERMDTLFFHISFALILRFAVENLRHASFENDAEAEILHRARPRLEAIREEAKRRRERRQKKQTE